MKKFLIATAVIELGAGIALMGSPAFTASILIGAPFDTPADSIVGRVAGAALLALVLACWLARNDDHTSAATGIVSGMLLYNVGVIVVLVYAGIGLRLFGVALWPAVALHAVMTVWCINCLLKKPTQMSMK